MFTFCHFPNKNFFDSEFIFIAFLEPISFKTTHFFDQTKYRETPIKTNKVVHTGPKIQFGGLKDGLFKVAYQEPIAGVVKIAPIDPANSQIIIQTKSFNRLLYFIK